LTPCARRRSRTSTGHRLRSDRRAPRSWLSTQADVWNSLQKSTPPWDSGVGSLSYPAWIQDSSQ